MVSIGAWRLSEVPRVLFWLNLAGVVLLISLEAKGGSLVSPKVHPFPMGQELRDPHVDGHEDLSFLADSTFLWLWHCPCIHTARPEGTWPLWALGSSPPSRCVGNGKVISLSFISSCDFLVLWNRVMKWPQARTCVSVMSELKLATTVIISW